MSNVRLTYALRQTILEKLMKNAFKEQQVVLKARKQVLGLKIYHHFISEDLEKKLRTVPREYLTMNESISGQVTATKGSKDYRTYNFELDKGYPFRFSRYQDSMEGFVDPVIFAAVNSVNKASNDLSNATAALRAKLSGALNSCSSVRKLLETWPEVKEFLPDEALAAVPSMPMVIIKDVNAALNRAGVEFAEAV